MFDATGWPGTWKIQLPADRLVTIGLVARISDETVRRRDGSTHLADSARQMRTLVDHDFPDGTVIRLVIDNLNTHTPAALSATFPPA